MKKFILFIFILIVLAACSGVGLWFYLQTPVDKSDKEIIEVKIESGTSSTKIGTILKEKGLIRDVNFFKLYLKINKISSLKASKYKFTKSMNLEEIIKSLEEGVINNEDALKLTFRDGERITDYANVIAKGLDIEYSEVIKTMQDRTYMQELIPKYWFLTDSILDENIYYPLEGYLAPETYYFEKDATINDIIIRLLDQESENLKKFKTSIESKPHYYLTMASMLQLEGTNEENRKMIAGVFLNRLNGGYNLGSDVTTYYALQRDMKEDLSAAEFATVNPYNTRGADMISKMPVGPICNPDIESIEASVNPTENDYLFFVADKHGKIYYSKTMAEHNANITKIKQEGNWIFD